MEYAGDCTYSDLQRNSMSYDFKGLHLTGNFNTQVGTQPDRQNGWAGTNSYSGGYEAINKRLGIVHQNFMYPKQQILIIGRILILLQTGLSTLLVQVATLRSYNA